MKDELKIGNLREQLIAIELMHGKIVVKYALFPFLGNIQFSNGWIWQVSLN